MKEGFRKDVVLEVIKENPEALDNDNLLIALCLKKEYKTTDILIVASITGIGVCEAYTRARRRIQEENPIYESSKRVREHRRKLEEEYREWYRNER